MFLIITTAQQNFSGQTGTKSHPLEEGFGAGKSICIQALQ